MFSDSHCHLDYFPNPAEAIAEARKQGVEKIVANSTNFEGLHKVLALQREFPGTVLAALGYHPTHFAEDSAAKIDETMQEIALHAKEAIAFGEVGLEFDDSTIPEIKETQYSIFRKFISLSKEFSKPLIVHARGARAEVLRILQEENCKKVLLHSFVCKEAQMKQLLKTPFFVSVGAGVLNSEWIQKFAKDLPLEKLLLETDSPLTFGSEKCSPAWIPRIAAKIAELKGLNIQEIEENTQKNFNSFFKH